MAWRWWPVRTVRERLRARIDELDACARVHMAAVPHGERDDHWRAEMDKMLSERSALMTQRDLGFMITDRRRVRG